MPTRFLGLLQDPAEAVFLPAVSFGYLYTKHDSLRTCSTITEFLPSFEFLPALFWGLALVSTILASFMYGAGGEPDKPTNPRDIHSLPIFASLIHILLMVFSFIELMSRVCSGDLLVVSLSLLYVALPIVQITEEIYT